jgi:hypothetical protein
LYECGTGSLLEPPKLAMGLLIYSCAMGTLSSRQRVRYYKAAYTNATPPKVKA